MKWYSERIVAMSRRSPKGYTAFYIMSVVALLVALAFLPITIKSFVYPLVFDAKENSGVIEAVVKKKENQAVGRGRMIETSNYYFIVDDLYIEVFPSDIRTYGEGDSFSYWEYTRGETVLGERQKLNLFVGIILFVGSVVIFGNALAVILTETCERELQKRKKLAEAKMPEKIDYNTLTVKQLYTLCQERGISENKTKQRNREHLVRCLREEDEYRQRYFEKIIKEREKEKRWRIWQNLLICGGFAFFMVPFSKVLYYFILLFL